MVSRAARMIVEEWIVCLFFAIVILILGSTATYTGQGLFIKIVLYFMGVNVCCAFLLWLGKALKGEKTPNPYKFILFGKDKTRYDFFVLLALFGTVLFQLAMLVVFSAY
jgi:hypothetical protein